MDTPPLAGRQAKSGTAAAIAAGGFAKARSSSFSVFERNVMTSNRLASWMLEQEARALLTRLARVRPFALHETMVPAAALLPRAQAGIERYLVAGRRELR